MSAGQLTVEAFGAGELVPSFEGPNAVRDGVLDATLCMATHWAHEYGMPMFTSNPGLFSDPFDFWYWIKFGGGIEIWRDSVPAGVHIMVGAIFDTENFLWTNTPIRTIDDLMGMRFRMMPLGGDIMAANGCSVVFLPSGEIVPSIERGVIDAAEFSVSAVDRDLGFHDVARYYHKPGWHQPSFMMQLAINMNSWNRLPDHLQAIVEAAADANCVYTWMQCALVNTAAEVQFAANGNQLVILPDEVINTFWEWTDTWFEEMEATDPFFRRVRESQRNFLQWWVPYKTNLHIPYPEWAFERQDEYPFIFVPKT
jgi:TRAP-type mannitol/chloroaromatic compound transport system substrate-binding protein